MRSNRKVIAGLIAAAAFAASGSLVYAQPQVPAPERGYQAGGPEAHHGMMGHGMREGHEQHGQWSNPAARVEGYLAALKVELKIAPAQEKAWQTFADRTRKQSEARTAQHAKFAAQPKTENLPVITSTDIAAYAEVFGESDAAKRLFCRGSYTVGTVEPQGAAPDAMVLSAPQAEMAAAAIKTSTSAEPAPVTVPLPAARPPSLPR